MALKSLQQWAMPLQHMKNKHGVALQPFIWVDRQCVEASAKQWTLVPAPHRQNELKRYQDEHGLTPHYFLDLKGQLVPLLLYEEGPLPEALSALDKSASLQLSAVKTESTAGLHHLASELLRLLIMVSFGGVYADLGGVWLEGSTSLNPDNVVFAPGMDVQPGYMRVSNKLLCVDSLIIASRNSRLLQGLLDKLKDTHGSYPTVKRWVYANYLDLLGTETARSHWSKHLAGTFKIDPVNYSWMLADGSPGEASLPMAGAAALSGVKSKPVLCPPNYWEDKQLHLKAEPGKDMPLDAAGAAVYKKSQNVPHEYIKQLQEDLIALGYLPDAEGSRNGGFGPQTARAVTRFQRHAARVYRMPQPDIKPEEAFTGGASGECDYATAQEIRKWRDRKWTLPLGRFAIKDLEVGRVKVGRLREDAAEAWKEIVDLVEEAGGTLEGAYGDTARAVQTTTKVGTSKYSFHYCGRAVDINQSLASGKGQRYYIAKEDSDGNTYWRIYCKTEKQDGTQGTEYKRGSIKCYAFFNWKEYDIPQGYYIDLTALIESTGKFERIKAQSGWNGTYNKTEWWHFQYIVDKQETFLDEMELIGYSEKKLRDAGWATDEALDHKPG